MNTIWRTTQQIAEDTGLSIDTLRYYERIGLIRDVQRAANGHRRYSTDDMTWILFLKQLRATGMSIAKMQHFAELRRGGDETIPQRRAMLEQHRQELEEQIAQRREFISIIDAKIARHQQYEDTNQKGLSGKSEQNRALSD